VQVDEHVNGDNCYTAQVQREQELNNRISVRLWAAMIPHVYRAPTPTTLAQLRNRIAQTWHDEIHMDECRAAINSVNRRFEAMERAGGSQFEHQL
jgi:hypothetical protein